MSKNAWEHNLFESLFAGGYGLVPVSRSYTFVFPSLSRKDEFNHPAWLMGGPANRLPDPQDFAFKKQRYRSVTKR